MLHLLSGACFVIVLLFWKSWSHSCDVDGGSRSRDRSDKTIDCMDNAKAPGPSSGIGVGVNFNQGIWH